MPTVLDHTGRLISPTSSRRRAGALVVLVWLFVAFWTQAGEPPRDIAPTSRATTTTNAEVYPIRISLHAGTNATTVSNKSPVRLHQAGLQQFMEATTEGRRFGRSLAVADIDGDGFLDLFIGQPRGASTRTPGTVFMFQGDADGLFSAAPKLIAGSRPRDLFGLAMANVGDANGDGLSDLVIAAPAYSNNEPQEGAFFILYGRRNARLLHPEFHFESDQLQFYFAISVTSAGDVNGDGFSDLLVGAPRHPVKSFQQGAAYLHAGSPTGVVSRAVWGCYGDQREAHCGQAVAATGDVNGDGYADVLIGMPDYDTEHSDAGRVWLFLGSKSGLKDTPDWTADGPHAHARFGAALAPAGDLNGDGFDDVLIGAPGVGDAVKLSGWVYAFYGGRNGLAKAPAWSASDGQDGAQFGAAIAAVGDVNGDLRRDVLVGAPGFDGLHADQGRVCLFLGTKDGLRTTPDWTLEGGQPGAECGDCVTGASDLNRDGLNDFVVSAPAYSALQVRAGRVDVFFGSRTAYQRQSDFPADGMNSVALPRQAFKPSALMQTNQPPPPPLTAIYIGSAGLLFALGIGVFFWRRRSQAKVYEERERIARDLHDDLGSRLARISMLTELVRKDSSQTEESQKNAQILAETTREVLASMEQILWSVNPGNDTLENLVAFIVQYAGPFFAPTGIICRHQAPATLPERNIDAATRKNIFLTMKEALSNLARHSGATEARIAITFADPLLTIEVTDNGRGFADTPAVLSGNGPRRSRRGHGLENMRARMVEIGGQLVIESRPEGGTRVTLTVKV